jgi:hypothetical protein
MRPSGCSWLTMPLLLTFPLGPNGRGSLPHSGFFQLRAARMTCAATSDTSRHTSSPGTATMCRQQHRKQHPALMPASSFVWRTSCLLQQRQIPGQCMSHNLKEFSHIAGRVPYFSPDSTRHHHHRDLRLPPAASTCGDAIHLPSRLLAQCSAGQCRTAYPSLKGPQQPRLDHQRPPGPCSCGCASAAPASWQHVHSTSLLNRENLSLKC